MTNFQSDEPPEEFKSEFLEKYFCFISKHDWKEILKISTERLVQLGCECKPEKFSLQCTFYNEEQVVRMPFHVNIYTSRSSNDDEYVVEFQKRRSGDDLAYADLYAKFIQQDEGCGMVVRGTNGPFFMQRQTPNPLRNPFGPVVLNQDALDCLLNMVKDDSYDVRIEALSSLAKLVQTEANRGLVYHYPSMFSVLTSLLDVDYDRISYPTLIILKFLLKTDVKEGETLTGDGREQLSFKLGDLLTKKLKDKLLNGDIYKDLIISVVELIEI